MPISYYRIFSFEIAASLLILWPTVRTTQMFVCRKTCSIRIIVNNMIISFIMWFSFCFASRVAICQQKCLNGGVCTRPNVCSCSNAFEGPACERDVDECATGAHGCLGPTSRCVNMAGWYYCACSPGYQNVIIYPATSMSVTTTATSDLNVLESATWSPLSETMCQGKNEDDLINYR